MQTEESFCHHDNDREEDDKSHGDGGDRNYKRLQNRIIKQLLNRQSLLALQTKHDDDDDDLDGEEDDNDDHCDEDERKYLSALPLQAELVGCGDGRKLSCLSPIGDHIDDHRDLNDNHDYLDDDYDCPIK